MMVVGVVVVVAEVAAVVLPVQYLLACRATRTVATLHFALDYTACNTGSCTDSLMGRNGWTPTTLAMVEVEVDAVWMARQRM
jgi:hypothetical protein